MPEMMNEGGNPDAAQDESLIQSVMQRDMGPIFEAIGSRLKDLEEDLCESKDLLYKLCEGLIGAADGHKRTALTDELSSKYGKDIEPLDGFYKDTKGKGYMESLLEELMGEGAPDDAGRDEFVKKRIGEDRGKYGKYLGIKAEVEPPAEAKAEEAAPGGEMAAEAMESPAEQAEEEVIPEDGGGSPIDEIFNEVKSLGGKKRKLSEPIAPKGKK